MNEDLPNWRKRKELLWKEGTTAEARRETGDAFFQAGRLTDALNFYERAGHEEGMGRVLDRAVETGNWFLFRRCRDILGGERREEVETLARNAVERGKYLYAIRAFQSLGDRASAAGVLEKIRVVFPDASILIKQLEDEVAGKEEESPPPEKEAKGKKKK